MDDDDDEDDDSFVVAGCGGGGYCGTHHIVLWALKGHKVTQSVGLGRGDIV